MTTIYEALAAVMAEVDHVAKRERFTFRGIDATVNAVGPALRKHKVIVVPDVREFHYGEILVGKDRTPMGHARLIIAYTFYGPEGDSIVASAAGEAFDSGDKATPKASSVAFRTALLQALALPTDEPDPDSHTYERPPAEELVNTVPPLAAAKARAWTALKRLKPDDPDDELRDFTEAALQARGSSIADANTAMWDRLADEWSATA
jgi:ERF superfamily